MNPRRAGRGVQAVETALGVLATAAFRRPYLTLGLVLALSAAAVLKARTLHLDADLSRLLPEHAESVQALKALEARTGGLGAVTVILTGPSPALTQAADQITAALAHRPELRGVEDKLPLEFFQARALWFLAPEDVRALSASLAERVIFEKRRNNPLLLDMGDEPPPPLDTDALKAKLAARLGQVGLTTAKGNTTGDGRFMSADGETLVLFAKPTKRATDLVFAAQVVEAVRAEVATVLKGYPTLRFELSGRYAKRLEQQAALSSDLTWASFWAFLGLIAYLAFHFRRPSAVLQVLLPLAISLAWTFGLTAWLFEDLNLLTGMVGAILMGLGIDHGIHLLGRYEAERLAGALPEAAVTQAFGRTGRAVLAAAITTVAGFVGLALSDFRAFHEFGVVAAVGCSVVVLAYTTVLPALIGALGGHARLPHRPPRRSSFLSALPKLAPAVFWVGALVVLALSVNARDVGFEADFAALEDRDLPATKLDRQVNRLLGHSQTPLAALTNSRAEEAEVSAALRAKSDRAQVDFVLSLADLVPSITPALKAEFATLRRVVDAVPKGSLSEEDQRRFASLEEMVKSAPFDRAALPAPLRARFQALDAPPTAAGSVLIFPRISQSDGDAVGALADALRGTLAATQAKPLLAGEALVLADVLAEVKAEAPTVLFTTLALVFLVLSGLLGRMVPAVIALLVAVGTVSASIGLLAAAGLSLNYLNMVMIPVLFGVGVDGAVHLITRMEESPTEPMTALEETARAVIGALVTTALGFAPLLLAGHPGLRALGWLAVVGLLVNLVLCVVVVPAFLSLKRRYEDPAQLVSTMGLAGLSPKAPGTLGALLALPLGYALRAAAWPTWAVSLTLATVGAIWVVDLYLKGDKTKDPQEVVIDETVGCLIALAFVPFSWGWAAAAFGLFRLLDIVKPWPISWVDRQIHGGLGVMLDDVLAGLAAGGLLYGAGVLIA